MEVPGQRHHRLLSLVPRDRLARVLARVLSSEEFLSPYGVRSLSRAHAQPYELTIDGHVFRVAYEPAESRSGLFGGNSNWRGPVWLPVNYLLIESLQRLHYYYGDSFQIECPTGSGHKMTLWQVASELSRRLISLFLAAPDGHRPVHRGSGLPETDPNFAGLVTFFEYFHGDTGAGLGARAQTGWTALVAKLLEQSRLWKA
jgi:hypothetical protein